MAKNDVVAGDLPTTAAVRWEAKFKDACASRDSTVAKVQDLADLMLRSVPKAEDRRACVIGALLQVFQQAQAELRTASQVESDMRMKCAEERATKAVSDAVRAAFLAR